MKNKNIFKSIKLYIVLFVVLLLGAGFAIYSQYRPCKATFATFTESKKLVTNPGMGFYSLHCFSLTDSANAEDFFTQIMEEDYDTFVLLDVNLKYYRNNSISETGLSTLDELISIYRKNQIPLILRFVYDWDARAYETEPSSIEQILAHMEQIAPIVNKHEDSIYILQGSFTGDYGEMHHSNFSSDEELSLLMGKLQEVISPSIYLSVRTIEQLESLSCDTARIGLFNDGLLGSESDYGSYPEGERDAYLLLQNELCNTLPNGGEVIVDNPYNDIEKAVADLSTMHVSYLNRLYDLNVLNKWKQSTYNGENGFDYIARHLGYRYVISGAALSYDSFSKEPATLVVSLTNTGWASCYQDCYLSLQLTSEDGTVITYPYEKSVAFLPSMDETTCNFTLPLCDFKDGTYRITATLTDSKTGQALHFANSTATPTCLFLGEITLE